MPTPAAQGFVMPAEWEKHEATWLGWPHNRHDWPGKIAPIHWVFGEMARKIAAGEIVRIIVRDAAHERQARRVLEKARADLKQIEFFRWPTDRGWTRDFGPICVRRGGKRPEVAVAKFKFTAWGYKYPNWQLDNQIALKAAKALGLRVFRVACPGGRMPGHVTGKAFASRSHAHANSRVSMPPSEGDNDFALEGGGIEVNGRGTLLTTEECFQHPTVQIRNPGATRADYDRVFRDYLGATNVLWLGDGIVGDDTHGHVDDLCRFVNPTTVVMIQDSDPRDVNYRPLKENRERLAGMRLEDGGKITVVDLPCPAPLYYGDWRLPASYANFYISNAAVIVPTFNDPADRVALGILADLFPDRTVVGIHAVDLVLGFGTLHCLTQQQPAAKA